MQAPWWVEVLLWIARHSKWVPGVKSLTRRGRARVTLGVAKRLHLAILHQIRRLGPAMSDWNNGPEDAAAIAMQICTECRRLFCLMLELRDNQLHACLKLLINDGNGEPKVATWVRSQPFDDRPMEEGPNDSHEVQRNTVWAALLGQKDQNRQWRIFDCFACNNLPARADFDCDRANWKRYYQSTLVFPIRYVDRPNCPAVEILGFLAFDSPKVNAFAGMPDIFDYASNPQEYRDRLEDSTLFHLGGIIVDTIGAVLRQSHSERHLTETK